MYDSDHLINFLIFYKQLKESFCGTVAPEDADKSRFIGGLPYVLPLHGVSAGSDSRWALSKRHKKGSKYKMSTNREISPSLSITLWSHMKKKVRRRAFKAYAS